MAGSPIHLLWMADIIAECATAAVMYHRRTYVAFPVFFMLLAFLCAKSLLLVAMSALNLPTAYFYVYWIGSALRAIFIGGVIGEISLAILKPLRWLPEHISGYCLVVSCIVVSLPLLSSVLRTTECSECAYRVARQVNDIASWVFLIVLATLLLLSGLFEVSWSRRSIGISVGLLLELWIGSVASIISGLFGNAELHIANWVRLSAFLMTNCIWIASFLPPETEAALPLDSSPCAQDTQA